MLSDLTVTLAVWWTLFKEVFQTLHDYNLAWGLPFHTRFDDLKLPYFKVTEMSAS